MENDVGATRLRALSMRVVALGAALAVSSLAATGCSTDTVDDVVVCDATEYEGCPERWAYLWADED